MRILTVRQPWAHAIIFGGKDVENRVRPLGDYTGLVAIHAGLTRDDRGWVTSGAYQLSRTMGRGFPDAAGVIIGVVELRGTHRDGTPPCGSGGLCSPWAQVGDVHHLELANPRPLAQPIPYKGALGLRRLDDETIARIKEAIE